MPGWISLPQRHASPCPPMKSSHTQKAGPVGTSLTVETSLSPHKAITVGSLSPLMRLPLPRLRSGSLDTRSCMSFSSPPCLLPASLLPMWSSSICIVAVSRRCWLMKIVSRTVIAGVPTQHTVKRAVRSSHNGDEICARNSANSGNPPRCVSPSFPPPQTEAMPSPPLSAAGPSFGPPQCARAARVRSLGGQDFLPQVDGALRCPQGTSPYPQQRPRRHDAPVP